MSKFIENHISKLKEKNFLDPEMELKSILNQSLKQRKDNIFINNFEMNKINIKKFNSIFQRRINNEPLSKIIKQKEFYSLNFYVTNKVLDPRPETEFIIDAVKKYFPNFNKKIKICDLGTGSGCLAVTLAKIYKNSNILATDISFEAINIAKRNAKKHKVLNQIEFIKCNWINKKEKFDLIVSNPPYLTKNDYQNCSKEIKNFEPRIALWGGIDGLNSYKIISNLILTTMKNDCFLFFEIGKNQKKSIMNVFNKYNLKIIEIVNDYQSIERVLVIKNVNYS